MRNGNLDNIELTKEQLNCINFKAGDMLIKGVAGSGKSYVILKRAVKLHKKKEKNESIAIFTYTNSLVKYTNDLIEANLGQEEIKVLTVDSYCMGVYRRITGRSFYVGKSTDYTRIIKETLEGHKKKNKLNHRFYDMDVTFFEEEFRWIKEKCIKTKETYISADRKGRGSQVRLSNSDKEMAWSIYELFMLKAKRNRFKDWADIYMELNDNLHRIPDDMKIDYILIDEAQDMTVGKLRVLKALTRKSITIAADIAQKIYKTSFTWKETGINISGRSSKSLSKSFRSTKQIVKLAEDLMAHNRKKSMASDEYTTAILPEIEGNKPRLVRSSSLAEENAYLVKLLKEYPIHEEVIGIICRTDKSIYQMKKLLSKNGLAYEVVDKKKKEEAKWSLITPGIKLVTAHSSKGLEFEKVIIPYLDDSIYPLATFKVDEEQFDEQLDEHLQMERSILYVAMTRARSTLTMLCINASSSRFIEEFNPEHFDDVKI